MWVRVIDEDSLELINSNEAILHNDAWYSGATWTSWDKNVLAAMNIYPARYEGNAPTRFHTPSGYHSYDIIDNEVVIFRNFVAIDLETAKSRAYKILADWRWQREEAGTYVEALNTTVPTDRTTQIKIMAAYIKARESSDFIIPSWKFADGVLISLDANLIIAIGDAITNHVQECFNEEANISNMIQTATSAEELENILTMHLT